MSIRQDYLPAQFWIPGSLNARDTATQALLTAQVASPYALSNFASLQTTNPTLYRRMAANAFFTAATVQRQSPAAAVLPHQQPDATATCRSARSRLGRF